MLGFYFSDDFLFQMYIVDGLNLSHVMFMWLNHQQL